MAWPTLTLISKYISRNDYLDLFQQLGGTLVGYNNPYDGTLQRGIPNEYLDGYYIKMTHMNLDIIKYDYPELWQQICDYFQSIPQTEIILDVFRTDESYRLALECIQIMSQQWKCILLLDDFSLFLSEQIPKLSYEDLKS